MQEMMHDVDVNDADRARQGESPNRSDSMDETIVGYVVEQYDGPAGGEHIKR